MLEHILKPLPNTRGLNVINDHGLTRESCWPRGPTPGGVRTSLAKSETLNWGREPSSLGADREDLLGGNEKGDPFGSPFSFNWKTVALTDAQGIVL